MNNNFKNTVMCTLHDFLRSKVRFIHTSTVTGSDSCSQKKMRVLLVYILLCFCFDQVMVSNISMFNLSSVSDYTYIHFFAFAKSTLIAQLI